MELDIIIEQSKKLGKIEMTQELLNWMSANYESVNASTLLAKIKGLNANK